MLKFWFKSESENFWRTLYVYVSDDEINDLLLSVLLLFVRFW